MVFGLEQKEHDEEHIVRFALGDASAFYVMCFTGPTYECFESQEVAFVGWCGSIQSNSIARWPPPAVPSFCAHTIPRANGRPIDANRATQSHIDWWPSFPHHLDT